MISVCIATHNGEAHIVEQVNSILEQLGENDEVVVSDDGSSDNTLELLRSYNDHRIRIVDYKRASIKCRTSTLVAYNFQNALFHAKGDIIFLSDQDDVWLPNKVSMCLQALEKCDLVVHNFMLCNEAMDYSGKNQYDGTYPFWDIFAIRNTYYGCTMAFRRKVLSYALPFPPKLELHDFWIGLLTEFEGNVEYIDEPLIKYRINGNSVSHSSGYSFLHKINYRFYIIWHLFLRIVFKKI